MTPLETLLREMIEAEGPLPLDRYMALCLGHPRFGYYTSREVFGASGDFITAPEISQVFGELIGIWCMIAWQAMGQPGRFNLVELGPGRGTLMADIFRASRVMPAFQAATDVHLVESSARLRDIQKLALNRDAVWHENLAQVPEGPMLLVANEFFDALPIRQFERRGGRWHERVVGLREDRLAIGLIDARAPAGQGGSEGAVVERADAREALAREIGARLSRHTGCTLIIDYGHLTSAPGDTLQALRGHAYVPVTEAPGHCDITAHVDFMALAASLAEGGAQTWPAMTQRGFLLAMGLEPRSAALAAKSTAETAAALQRSTARLADAGQMGNLFKVLAAGSPGMPPPYPFGGT